MDIKEFSPLWESWHIGEVIGRGTYGTVYKVYKKEFGKTYYSAVKHISIPENKQQTDELFAEGLVNEKSVNDYYKQIVDDLRNEIETNYALKGNSHIVSYEDHKIVPKKSGVGYDIFIRMELLTNLSAVLKDKFMSIDEVVKLGIDLCEALETLENKRIIHRDIKPSNLFVGDSGNYKLGDFGVARELTKTVSGMSVKGTFKYMAPEIQRGGKVNFTADIYSLGIVMYHLLNYNRAPFLPVHPKPISYTDNERAIQLRMSGQALPKPANADIELASIILKACEYLPERRWQNAKTFRKALEKYQERKAAGLIGKGKPVLLPTDNYPENNKKVNAATAKVDNRHADKPVKPEKVNSKNQALGGETPPSNMSIKVLIALVTVCITLILTAGGVFLVYFSGDGFATETNTKTITTAYNAIDDFQNQDNDLETLDREDGTSTAPKITTTEANDEPVAPRYYYDSVDQIYLVINTKGEDGLAWRTKPTLFGDGVKTFDRIKKGERVRLVGTNENYSNFYDLTWVYVEYNGEYGWVFTNNNRYYKTKDYSYIVPEYDYDPYANEYNDETYYNEPDYGDYSEYDNDYSVVEDYDITPDEVPMEDDYYF